MEPVVFLFDIDNTLLDNDRVTRDLHKYLDTFGEDSSRRYFEIFEELRKELGYADYLGTLQRYRLEDLHDARLLRMSTFLVDYPFANRLFPGSLDAIEHVQQWGTAAILSDGDAVFQPRKIERSGIFEAIDRHVMIFIHKENNLDDVERLHPAKHYVMIDDKLRILAAMKEIWGNKLTTVFVKQGHYAKAPGVESAYPAPDITIDRIGDLVNVDFSYLKNPA
jgi:FMN phosphatase YigB (HAD superfamily)